MKPILYIYPTELKNDVFADSTDLRVSTLKDLLLYNYSLKPEYDTSINSLLHDIELFKEYRLFIFFPMPMASTCLLEEKNANVWFKLFEKCLKIVKQRPESRLITGCDWDEYNVGNYFNKDLITKILARLRKSKISFQQLTWLYCNPMVPKWIRERLFDGETEPNTLYFSSYLRRLKRLDSEYMPTIDKHTKTKWFLSLNRIGRHHRINLAYWWFKNGYRPANISCRAAIGSRIGTDLIDTLSFAEYQNLRESFGFDPENKEEHLYDQFVKSLPWNIDNLNPGGSLPLTMQDKLPKHLVHESACYIITETHFSLSDWPWYDGWISEKTLKGFLYGLPCIWIAPRGTINSIKQLGFESFPNLINEDYDNEINGVKRFNLVTKEMDRIQRINDISYWYNQGYEIYKHNRSVLEKMFNTPTLKLIEEYHENWVKST